MTTKNGSELLRPDSSTEELNLMEDQLLQDDFIHQAPSVSASSDVQHVVESEPQSVVTFAQQETTSVGLKLPSTTKLTFRSDTATFDVIAKVKKDCDKARNMLRHQNLVSALGEFSSKLEQILPFMQTTLGTIMLVICTGNAEDSERLAASGECVSQAPEDEELATGYAMAQTPDTPVVVSAVKKSGVKLKLPNNEPDTETEMVKILGEIDLRDQESQADSHRDQNQATQTPTTAEATPINGSFVDLACRQWLPSGVVEELNDTSLQGLIKLWGLGSGTFGKVDLVQCLKTGRMFANKQLKWLADGSAEFKIMGDLRHRNIARILGYRCENDVSHLLLEWFPVTLKDLVERRRHLEETVATVYMKQLLDGLWYLHDNKAIVHRDIKPDNLFIDSQGTLKIGDFGNACRLQDCEEDQHPLGTLLYNAPEYMKGEPYSTACDIWSSGVVLAYMATGQTIWTHYEKAEMNPMNLIFLIGNIDKTPSLPELKSEQLYDLMAKCLRVEKNTRPSAKELLAHDVFKSLPSADVDGSALAAFDSECTVTDVSDAFAT